MANAKRDHNFPIFSKLFDEDRAVTENRECWLIAFIAGTPSTSIFTFNKEDHTLGNLLRSRLLQTPHVTFSAYKVPHPLVR